MTYQYINLGTAPSGAGGDTFRSTGTKVNENFTNNAHAASRYVGVAAGNLMEVGAFGLGTAGQNVSANTVKGNGFYQNSDVLDGGYQWGNYIEVNGGGGGGGGQIYFGSVESNLVYIRTRYANSWGALKLLRHSGNTTIDSNGFIKAASPVAQLYADKIAANEEASEQNPIFEKVGIGHYLIKNTLGFAKEGWWIEVPTDANGNRICAVEYQTLENGDLEIKTFKKKLNEEGDIVANLEAPIDIPSNANGEPRWIDVRLHSVAKPIVRKVPRTEKQARMVQQVKYAPQLTYITKYEDLFDDEGKPVIVDGQKYQKPVTHIQTDKNGTPILSDQPVTNENGEPVFEWVQAIDSEDQPIFDDVPVLNEDGNQIYDEVTYEPQQ
ncbi:pyocin knob domain-containing protein [Acinetobacter guillouiae]|uniref:pyocin knob domain-containing protein n=1 Tax=Acinetobacter guillouiae TaxID=106649 RepID=UPI003AF53664